MIIKREKQLPGGIKFRVVDEAEFWKDVYVAVVKKPGQEDPRVWADRAVLLLRERVQVEKVG